MKNFEYHKDKILEFVNDDEDFGCLENGKLCACNDMLKCEECIFYGNNCSSNIIKWLYEEHIEKPRLTKKERMFCELIETGWISRDENGDLYVRNYKPSKSRGYWFGMCGKPKEHGCDYISNIIFHDVFSFITWKDKEPWSVEELLKLEVEE